ncbi:DUF2062 domain-containing protein [Pseudoxanthobacter soli]|nr:DUF2062 domain-containing protein [Pseudoxanthobacter soli]
MLFRRREPLNWKQRLRVAAWPARSWRRSFYYMVKRILRLRASPHAIAIGTAAGVFVSCTPFLGFHILLATAFTYLVAGNVIAAVIATWFGNPITFPIIWASTYKLGRFMLGQSGTETPFHVSDLSAKLSTYSLRTIWPIIEPMIVGSVPIGIGCGLVTYIATRIAVAEFRKRQEARLRARREAASAKIRAEVVAGIGKRPS